MAEYEKRVRRLVMRHAHPSRVGVVLPGEWVDELVTKLVALHDEHDERTCAQQNGDCACR